ncbi:unnamed protein product [Rotaria sp. Silwood2]|nr:unnamed protein product [Rotaria sp. Silwood2]CAF3292045.1 unnamed protein product [Rotaria sp. Silwood2]
MQLESDLFSVEQVYGLPELNETKKDELIQINTLFPWPTGPKVTSIKCVSLACFSVTYEDCLGRSSEEKQWIHIHVNNEINYANSGIRKNIIVVNYITLLKKWIVDERERKYN